MVVPVTAPPVPVDEIPGVEEEEEEAGGDATGRVAPKSDSEFVCKSCFLVKSVSQRVAGTDDLCNDCV